MFIKKDNEFVCENCGNKVKKLEYTSRDHCNSCLYSKHVDKDPGDRLETCCGALVPYNVEMTSKKGEVIIYRCQKCGALRRNVVARDDSREQIYKIISNFAMKGGKI
ncbi:MAG: RNHCP domain-containing protein [Clostridia bacterium]